MKDGFVLIDKPIDWTSFDVVAKIRGRLKQETGIKKPKVGHTGTLDPKATGLMIVVVGKYTKRAQEFSKMDKVYEAELILGAVSSTDDSEGEITQKSDQIPTDAEVKDALNKFVGEIRQIPPAFSAIKINGKRAYKLARDGKEVEIEPRRVKVYEISNVEYSYPKVRFTISVSSGTYIRSVARDVGDDLGTGAYLSGLRRTSVGQFFISNAINVSEFTLESVKEL